MTEPLNNVSVVTKEMAANVAMEKAKDENITGIIVLGIHKNGTFHSTLSDGCYKKMFLTIGVLSYVKSIFESECKRLNASDDEGDE